MAVKINKSLSPLSSASWKVIGGRRYTLAVIKHTITAAQKEAKLYRTEGYLASVGSTGERPFSSCRNGKPAYAVWVRRITK